MKLSVIIPVRNRDRQLNILINKLSNIFRATNIEYRFYVVYQDDNKPFNKGKISNLAFLYAVNDNFSCNFLFNDVTVFPNFNFDYKYPFKNNVIYNPFGYRHCLGRFFLINSSTYRKLNGYSNKYNGWGYEDSDLQKRCELLNVTIDREKFLGRVSNLKDNFRWFSDEFSIDYTYSKMNVAAKPGGTSAIYNNKWFPKFKNKPIFIQNNILHDILTDGLSSLNVNQYINRVDKLNNNDKQIVKIYATI